METKAKDYISRFTEIFKNKNRKAVLMVFLGGFGIILLLLSELSSDTPKTKNDYDYISLFDTKEREEELEKKLSEIISKINGAGKTIVMVTIDCSKEFIYEKNSEELKDDNKSERRNELVILEGEEDFPVLLKTEEEKIRGVLIICEGGGNPLVREKIIESICALLDIPSTKVSVAEMAL